MWTREKHGEHWNGSQDKDLRNLKRKRAHCEPFIFIVVLGKITNWIKEEHEHLNTVTGHETFEPVKTNDFLYIDDAQLVNVWNKEIKIVKMKRT